MRTRRALRWSSSSFASTWREPEDQARLLSKVRPPSRAQLDCFAHASFFQVSHSSAPAGPLRRSSSTTARPSDSACRRSPGSRNRLRRSPRRVGSKFLAGLTGRGPTRSSRSVCRRATSMRALWRRGRWRWSLLWIRREEGGERADDGRYLTGRFMRNEVCLVQYAPRTESCKPAEACKQNRSMLITARDQLRTCPPRLTPSP